MSQCYQKFTVEKPGNPTTVYLLDWGWGGEDVSPLSQISVLLGHYEDL